MNTNTNLMISYVLRNDDPHKGVMLELHVLNPRDEDAMRTAQEFCHKVYSSMPKESGWFHQSGVTPDNRPSDYHMFEFWNFLAMPEVVIQTAKEIGEELGLDLVIGDSVMSLIESKAGELKA